MAQRNGDGVTTVVEKVKKSFKTLRRSASWCPDGGRKRFSPLPITWVPNDAIR